MARIMAAGVPEIPPRQDQTPPIDRRLKRIGTGVQDAPPDMRPYTAQSMVDQRLRCSASSNDALIRRDGQPQWLIQNYQRAGAQVNNWTAAGPARPTLWTVRGQTLTPRSGGKVRWLQNPAAPGTGLHTEVNNDASGAIGTQARYLNPTSGVRQRGRRQNRLSPALYSGQSFSQTTKLQGTR